MALNRVREIWNGRTGSTSVVMSVEDVLARDDDTEREYVRVFRCETGDPTNGPPTLMGPQGILRGLPQLLDPYVDADGVPDARALCKSVRPDVDQNDPKTWVYKCDYSTALTADPLRKPTIIEVDEQKFSRAIYEDINGVAIVNAAGDPFDPPLEVDDSRPTLRFTRNEAASNQALAADFKDALNLDTFFGFDPLTVKVARIACVLMVDSRIAYYRCTYEFHVDPRGWDAIVLNAGHQAWNDFDQKVLIRDPQDGTPLSSPTLLDAEGRQLAKAAKPVYLKFPVYPRKLFVGLRLP